MSKILPKRRTQRASQQNRSDLVDMLSNIEERAIPLETLRFDGGTQPREKLDAETLDDYVLRMKPGEDAQRRPRVLDPEGQTWPALMVFFDGEHHWLADGFHRAQAAAQANISTFQARIQRGSLRDAIEYSLGVNATHGKRRTNADKRRVVERALTDSEWALHSDNKIASMCKVSQPFVSKVRKALTERGEIQRTSERVGRDGEVYEVQDMVTQRRSKPAAAKKQAPPQLDSTTLGFEDIASALTSQGMVLAHPTTRAHWGALGQLLDAPDIELLVVTLPDGGDLFWEGPAALAAQSSGSNPQPAWCLLKNTQQLALLWSARPLPPAGAIASVRELAAHLHTQALTHIQ